MERQKQKVTKDQNPPARNNRVHRNTVQSHDSHLACNVPLAATLCNVLFTRPLSRQTCHVIRPDWRSGLCGVHGGRCCCGESHDFLPK